jgi:cholesterol oxidase
MKARPARPAAALAASLGGSVRTNSESLIGGHHPGRAPTRTSRKRRRHYGSILHTDAHSAHRARAVPGAGSGFFRTARACPHVGGSSRRLTRIGGAAMQVGVVTRHALKMLKAVHSCGTSRSSEPVMLLYMRTLEGTLTMTLGRGPRHRLSAWCRHPARRSRCPPRRPTMPEALELARRFGGEARRRVGDASLTETVLGVPTTAHILGGCVYGLTAPPTGVIDSRQPRLRLRGSVRRSTAPPISANPGVNPSLTITALAERALTPRPREGVRWSSCPAR